MDGGQIKEEKSSNYIEERKKNTPLPPSTRQIISVCNSSARRLPNIYVQLEENVHQAIDRSGIPSVEEGGGRVPLPPWQVA